MARHIPVLVEEVVQSLSLVSNMNVIDCTLGDGGHAERILKAIGPNGRLLGIDADPESLLRAKKYLYGFGKRVTYVRDNFERLEAIVEETHFGPTDGILMDLGWSSPQVEERGRGFSFQKNEPLDMRYGTNVQCSIFPAANEAPPSGGGNFQNPTASDLLNGLSGDKIEKILREYGEEELSGQIAEAIVSKRKEARVETTEDLVEIILDVYRKKLKTDKAVPWVGGLHPATKVFQAFRIAVNDELGVIERALPQAIDVLKPKGRLAVITFHSLEDRIVKHFFKKEDGKIVHIVTKKPIEPNTEEYEANPRARSAKLRVVEKI